MVKEMPTLEGLAVVFSAGPDRKAIVPLQDPSIVDWVSVRTGLPWPRTRKYRCGHRGARKYLIHLWGEQFTPGSKKSICPACALDELQRTAVRCCLCGFPILPGAPVAVYDLQSVKPKDYPFAIEDGKYAVGCLRWDCCPSGGFFDGHWNGKSVDRYKFG